MTEQMARIAANNIAADVLGTQKTTHELRVECIMDMGNEAAHMVADPVRPPRNVSRLSHGKRWLFAKRFFANYYLWKLRLGANKSPRWVW
jgi:sulfide:quinone oxidoreductase